MGKSHESKNGVILSFRLRSSWSCLLNHLWTSTICKAVWCLSSLSAVFSPLLNQLSLGLWMNVTYHPWPEPERERNALEGKKYPPPLPPLWELFLVRQANYLIWKHYVSNGHHLKISELLSNDLFVIFVESGASRRSWSSKFCYAYTPLNWCWWWCDY